jgi:hypothetical protein
MALLKDDDNVHDQSLQSLMKIAKENKKEKEAKMVTPLSNLEADEQVDKLVGLLNTYTYWEIRGLLVSILQNQKGETLKQRLAGGSRDDTGKTDKGSHTPDGVEDQSMPDEKAEEESSAQSGAAAGTRARRHAREDHRLPSSVRRSGSVSRQRLVRSLSADKKLGAMVTAGAQKNSEGSRQAAILAKRREHDKAKAEAQTKNGGRSPRENGPISPTPEHAESRPRNQSISPMRMILPRRPLLTGRSGSADNLQGFSRSSTHSAKGRSAAVGRGTRNASFKLEGLGMSLHGVNSGTIGSERKLRDIGFQRSHSLRCYDGNWGADKASADDGSLHSPQLPTHNGHLRRASSQERSVLPPREASERSRTGDLALEESRDPSRDQAKFLQFHPGPAEKQIESCRHSAKVDQIVDELRTSYHNPFKVEEFEPACTKKRENADIVKKSFQFFLGKKLMKGGAVALGDDPDSEEESNESDVESI